MEEGGCDCLQLEQLWSSFPHKASRKSPGSLQETLLEWSGFTYAFQTGLKKVWKGAGVPEQAPAWSPGAPKAEYVTWTTTNYTQEQKM